MWPDHEVIDAALKKEASVFPQRESPLTSEGCFKGAFCAYYASLPKVIVSHDGVAVLTEEQVNMEVIAKVSGIDVQCGYTDT